ncbi:MAG: hypothetical protein JW818_15935 [Pirellulales bacterium]|nr:hypothetical protein [Pirellulales bacterium]
MKSKISDLKSELSE